MLHSSCYQPFAPSIQRSSVYFNFNNFCLSSRYILEPMKTEVSCLVLAVCLFAYGEYLYLVAWPLLQSLPFDSS